MKQNVMALVVALGMIGLAGCAELQQITGTPQAAPQAVQQENVAVNTTSQAQAVPQQQAQESSFLSDMIKTAKDTLGSEAKSAVQSTIRSAGSSIRN